MMVCFIVVLIFVFNDGCDLVIIEMFIVLNCYFYEVIDLGVEFYCGRFWWLWKLVFLVFFLVLFCDKKFIGFLLY